MYDFENTKILIVDDEDLLREVIVETFELYGAKVDFAQGGHEALEKIKFNHYDLLITDIRMPNGDGISLIADIKKLDKLLPKVFVCSAFNDLTAEKIKDLNIVHVFSKPFELDFLLQTVIKSLANSKA